MSGFRFKLRAAPQERLDLSKLVPGALAAMSAVDIQRMVVGIGKNRFTVADVFSVSGRPGETLVFEGGSDKFDYVGATHTGGTVIVEGDVGAYAGLGMRNGTLDIRGSAGPYLASGLSGGLLTVRKSAGDFVGGPMTGKRFGMMGGTVVVEGGVGANVGDRMRRGTIISRLRTGPRAGLRMMGGTIWSEGGFGDAPGMLMRRGTLIGPSVERMLPTFADCGRHDLLMLRILSNYLSLALGSLAPKPLRGPIQRFAGDMATIGKGEVLIG